MLHTPWFNWYTIKSISHCVFQFKLSLNIIAIIDSSLDLSETMVMYDGFAHRNTNAHTHIPQHSAQGKNNAINVFIIYVLRILVFHIDHILGDRVLFFLFCWSDEKIMRSLIINAHLALIEMLIYLIGAIFLHVHLFLRLKLLNSQSTHALAHKCESNECKRQRERYSKVIEHICCRHKYVVATYIQLMVFRYHFDFVSVILTISDANKCYFVHSYLPHIHCRCVVERNKISFVFRLYLTHPVYVNVLLYIVKRKIVYLMGTWLKFSISSHREIHKWKMIREKKKTNLWCKYGTAQNKDNSLFIQFSMQISDLRLE